jgi:endoglucanase
MTHRIKRHLSTALLALALSDWFTSDCRAANSDSLIANADMEQPNREHNWPAGWPTLAGYSSWEKEGENHFIRITATEPDKMLALPLSIPIPAGTAALALTYKVRCTGLKVGHEPWFDARVIMDVKDASGNRISSPDPVYVRGDTKGWVEKEVAFAVPKGAATLFLMPVLFQVKAGTMDLDDMVLKAVSSAEVLAVEARARENAPPTDPTPESAKPVKWPLPIKVAGNRLVDPSGREVWLQGLHVASLDWNPQGEAVLHTIRLGIDEWKARVIRLAINPDYWRASGAKGEAFKNLVDACVNMAANRGAYIIIDNHTYRAVREADITLWTDIATRYKNHPAVIFEIINEPHDISWEVWRNGGFVAEKQEKSDEDHFLTEEQKAQLKPGFQTPGMQKMVEIIRATGASNVILAGALDWSYDNSGLLKGYALEDKTGNGVMYSVHVYSWKHEWQKNFLDAAEVYPLFVGEVGANNQKLEWMDPKLQEDAVTWVPDIIAVIQKYRLNWSAFAFHPSCGPALLADWKYTPRPEWGVPAKEALSGRRFELGKMR